MKNTSESVSSSFYEVSEVSVYRLREAVGVGAGGNCKKNNVVYVTDDVETRQALSTVSSVAKTGVSNTVLYEDEVVANSNSNDV